MVAWIDHLEHRRRLFPSAARRNSPRGAAAQVEALRQTTSPLTQTGHLFLSLHALGDNFEAKVVRQSDDGCSDLRTVGVSSYVPDEGLVDLKHLDWEAFQIVERRISLATEADADN